MVSDRQLIQSDIEGYLRRYEAKELLRFVAVGSVDDGKSTLIGRLLFDTGSVYEDQLDAARKATQMAGVEVDLSLLTDGLAAEREQGITIDVAYRYFSTDKRKFIIADTPGHVQYTRNMVTGASTASVAIILIDARLGVLQQSRRHAYIASLLGIPHLAVCVNKMDLVAFDRSTFARIQQEFAAFTRGLSFVDVGFFPISALAGDNCVHGSARTPWYEGPTVLQFLETVPAREERDLDHFRYPVQYVLRPSLDYRGFAGRVASGQVKRGDAVVVLPSGKVSRVRAIDAAPCGRGGAPEAGTKVGPAPWEGVELEEAFAPQSVTLRLEDEIDVSRGDMLAHPGDLPRVTRTFDAHLVWMHETPLDTRRSYLLKHTTQTVRAEVERVHYRRDMDTLGEVAAETLGLNDIGRVTIAAHKRLFVDPYEQNRETGSFILIDTIGNTTLAAGMVIATTDRSRDGADDAGTPTGSSTASEVSVRERRARLGASRGVVLIRGGGAAAEALAYRIERALFDRGVVAVVLPSSASAAARSVAGSGLLVLLPTEVDADPATAPLEGTPSLVVRVSDVAPGEGGVRAVIAKLREADWID